LWRISVVADLQSDTTEYKDFQPVVADFSVVADLQSDTTEYKDFQSAFKHDYATSFAAEANIMVFESKQPQQEK